MHNARIFFSVAFVGEKLKEICSNADPIWVNVGDWSFDPHLFFIFFSNFFLFYALISDVKKRKKCVEKTLA